MTVIVLSRKSPAIRIISLRAYFERLPSGVREAMRKSTDNDVQDVIEGMKLSAYVDLDSYIILRDLQVLINAGVMTQAQADASRVDGQIYEKYNGAL